MGRSLLIFEKPKQARTVCKAFQHQDKKSHIEISPNDFFPQGAFAVWCVGHILRAKMPGAYKEEWKSWNLGNLPMILNIGEFRLEPDPKTRRQYNLVRKMVNSSDIENIFHYGDPGREGQLLIDEVLRFVKNRKPVKRVWETSMTKAAVYKALRKAKDNKKYENLYWEGYARQVSDWVIGMNASRCMSILMQNIGVNDSKFSLGRCKVPLTNIIYRRELEIENFTSKPFWDVYVTFQSETDTYIGKWMKRDEEHIWEKSQADALSCYCQTIGEAKVQSIHKEQKEVQVPQFFNLTDLQAEANKRFSYSPDKVLAIAQELYESGLLTYPRSDPRVVSTEEAKMFPSILNNLKGIEEYAPFLPAPIEDISSNKRFVNNALVDDHHAIIPTEEVVDPISLSEEQRNIYNMVVLSFIAAHYPHAVFDHTEIVTIVDDHFTFKTSGKVEVSKGWQAVLKPTNDKIRKQDPLVPELSEGLTVTIPSTEMKEGKTTPPKRFSQGQLVKIMERAASYITKEERQGYTHDEMSLGTVATRASIIKEIMANKYISVKKNLVYIEPKGRMLIEALGTSNWLATPVTTGKMENYLNEIGKGKKPYEPFLKRTNQLVDELVETMIEQSKQWDFTKEIKLEQEKSTFGPCILCGQPVVDKGKFYGCSAYRETNCSFTFPKEIGQKKIPLAEVRKFLSKKTTGLITGIIGKNGPFEAFIIWDEKKKQHKFGFDGTNNNRFKK